VFAVQRLARFVDYRHHEKRFKQGWDELVHQSPDQDRTAQPQRHRRRTQGEQALAGETECHTVNDVGEPRAGEPHARFDGRTLETDTSGPRRGHEFAGNRTA